MVTPYTKGIVKITKFGKTFTLIQWTGDFIGATIGLDTETNVIKHKGHVPDLVITTAYPGGSVVYIITNQYIKQFLDVHKSCTYIFHTFYFDRKVLTKATNFQWWSMIESDQIIDIALLYKLVIIATKGFSPGKWSLDYQVKKLLKDVLPKDDNVRLTFGQYLHDGKVDYKAMSKEHYIYAALDPVATLLVYEKLKEIIAGLRTSTNLAHKIHLMGDIALKDISDRGINIDQEYTATLRQSFLRPMQVELNVLATYGWIRGQKGNLEVYSGVCDYLGLDIPYTPSGQRSMKAENLLKYKDSEPFVKSLLNYLSLEHDNNFLNEIHGNSRIYPWYDSIKVTGRTSCKNPNIQNPPRKGGIRECLIPGEGNVFVDSDYGAIEMFTMADTLHKKYKQSNMYDILQTGGDPHTFVGAAIYNCSPNEVTQSQRQASKVANYGFLANMSEATFIEYALQFNTTFSMSDAKRIKKGWKEAYPEIIPHWKEAYRRKTYISETGFIRAYCKSTEWLNCHFQGKAAEGAKIALYMNLKDGIKQVMFIHDQIISDHPKSEAEDVLKRQNANMIAGMKIICPMNISVSGKLQERFCK